MQQTEITIAQKRNISLLCIIQLCTNIIVLYLNYSFKHLFNIMTAENNQHENELKAFLNSIPAGDLKDFEKLLIQSAKTTSYIFRNWRLGITRIPRLERAVMNADAILKYNRKIFKSEE